MGIDDTPYVRGERLRNHVGLAVTVEPVGQLNHMLSDTTPVGLVRLLRTSKKSDAC